MIQRIQTLYLIVVILLGAVVPFFVNLWSDARGNEIFAENAVFVSIAFYAVAVLGLLGIVLLNVVLVCTSVQLLKILLMQVHTLHLRL